MDGLEIQLNGFCEGKIFIINCLDGWLRLDIGVTVFIVAPCIS